MTPVSAHKENLRILGSIPRFAIYIFVGCILFFMPLHIDINLKHVFNTAKEILFGKLLMSALVAWVTLLALKGRILIPKARAFYFFFATIVFMLISIFWSTSANLSLREISPQAGCFLLFFIVLTSIRSEKVIQNLITVTILAAFLVTLYGLAQYYDFDDRYFQIQNRPIVMDTFLGKITVPPGESAMSRILPLPFVEANRFFQGILLPQKPEEHFKIYAFMGHRNYFSGYLVLIIPLIFIRLARKLQLLVFEDLESSKPISKLRVSWDILSSAFYALSLVLMANAVLLTQTRGALLGMVVSLCFLVLCSLLLANRDNKAKVTYAVLGTVGLVAAILALMFITGEKRLFAGAITVAGLSFIGFLVAFKHMVRPLIIGLIFLCLAVGTYKVVVAPSRSGTIKSHRSTLHRITQTSDWKGSAHQRTLIYSTTLRIITDNFLSLVLGKGIGTFGIHYMGYQVKLFLDTEVSGKFLWDTNKSIYAHNEYIHWMSELGILGLSLMMGFWFFYIRRVLLGLRRSYSESHSINPLKSLTILALLAGTIGTLVHCMVTFDLHLMYSMVTFYCWAAFALVLCGVRLKEIAIPRLGFKVGLVLTGIIIAVLGWQQLNHVHFRDVYWRQAFYQFSQKAWQKSFDLYQKALTHDSTLGELLFDFGRALMDSNDNPRIPKSGIDKYNVKTIKRNLNLKTMYQRPEVLKVGETLPDNEDLTDVNLTNNFIAISSFLEATHNFTDPANFHNIALCFYKEAQRKRADQVMGKTLANKSEDYYRKAIDLNPIYAQSLSNLGYLKATRGEHEEAKTMLERAIRLKDGKSPTTYLGLAIIHQAKKDYDKALEMFLELARRNPNNAETFVRIGSLYLQMKESKKAEEYFLKAAGVAKNPKQKGRLERQALQIKIPRLQEVVKKAPDNRGAFMDLAFSFVKYGSLSVPIPNKENYLQQGIQALRSLIVKNPNNVEVRLKLAQAYEEIGDTKKLKRSYLNVLKIMSPTDARRIRVQRKLQLFSQ
jgi:tetratricopeptide (TPR) repeat protein